MPSRFTFIAMALAVPSLLAACEREGQQQAETEAAAPAAPQPGEAPAVAEPQPPATRDPGEQAAAPPDAGTREGEVVVVPPAGETPVGEQQTAQAPQQQAPGAEAPAQAPGERSPEAAGVASVAAYVGRWAEQVEMCQQSYWTFTNLRLQTPEGVACDIQSTGEQEGGVSLEVACTDQDQPLAEPRRGTMALAFPDLPDTDTMTVSGGPLESEERTLSRCPLG
jgi:hypothetical protein